MIDVAGGAVVVGEGVGAGARATCLGGGGGLGSLLCGRGGDSAFISTSGANVTDRF